jgi:hypothetical protein
MFHFVGIGKHRWVQNMNGKKQKYMFSMEIEDMVPRDFVVGKFFVGKFGDEILGNQ